MKAENKWDKEEDYIFLKKWIECNLKTDENLGIDKAIYEKLPKVIMQEKLILIFQALFLKERNLSPFFLLIQILKIVFLKIA